jgi:hypothetical protein
MNDTTLGGLLLWSARLDIALDGPAVALGDDVDVPNIAPDVYASAISKANMHQAKVNPAVKVNGPRHGEMGT